MATKYQVIYRKINNKDDDDIPLVQYVMKNKYCFLNNTPAINLFSKKYQEEEEDDDDQDLIPIGFISPNTKYKSIADKYKEKIKMQLNLDNGSDNKKEEDEDNIPLFQIKINCNI